MPTLKESHSAAELWCPSVLLDGCLAKQKVPWIGKTGDNCARFEDDVLFCPVLFQMFSRCVPVHPDVIVLFQHFICYVT